ncbi:hypothetical protein H6S82_16480 [Planktothrix sp. FACHB-1355]|uniref:Uncharacterized protein n=1 Tax=Aerosakkonema funiforme FACHB-1375 TaxID=2949571 RepID=A0A926VHR4_9CYAN|nr:MULTISPECIES: hypothetical protein [Oscillatoriales]MBD2182849.1 hypothetical protein [Aerosakkonema funiforme FACHB-1375]MBD3560437.1 hypothetical protein [Planktothrix sp. FACHB-1355]
MGAFTDLGGGRSRLYGCIYKVAIAGKPLFIATNLRTVKGLFVKIFTTYTRRAKKPSLVCD